MKNTPLPGVALLLIFSALPFLHFAKPPVAGAPIAATPVRASAPEPQVVPVTIETGAGPEIFPELWRSEKIDATATPATAGELARGSVAVLRAAGVYSPAVLQKNLRKVHLVGTLRYSGVAAVGTNSVRDLYIVVTRKNDPEGKGVERTFHHEFSSILLRNRRDLFNAAAWAAAGEPRDPGVASGVASIRAGAASMTIDPRFCETGYLSSYSRASEEEDFNIVVQYLFSGEPKLWEAVGKYPRIATKVRLTLAFYARLDPKLDEAFFLRRAGLQSFPAGAE